MIVEFAISWLDKANFILGILTFIALLIYTYFTYRIAEGDKKPRISFNLFQIMGEGKGHIGFSMLNKSKVDVEVWAKVWVRLNDELFSKDGFYGNNSSWALEPFMQGKGHFFVGELSNSKRETLSELSRKKGIKSVKLSIQIRYKKVGKRKGWKKSLVQMYGYDFEKDLFWLDV